MKTRALIFTASSALFLSACASLHNHGSGGDHADHGAADSTHAAHDHSAMHAKKPLRDNARTNVNCRAGAFVEASNIVNSVVEIAMALPPNTAARTRAELDTVLFTALKQARSEVHCVAGGLSFGYERSYAGVIQRGVALAQSRRLNREVIEMGQSVIATLEANRRIAAARDAAEVNAQLESQQNKN